MPHIEGPYLKTFSKNYLMPLQNYDYENNTSLFETVVEFVKSGGDIPKTADVMKQHKNTIRYRLEKINSILGENLLYRESYEKLSMAVKIYIGLESIRRFKESENIYDFASSSVLSGNS
jgi:sugar diacid utilization regulator